jgi:ATP-binding cassette subfamily B protein IrtA
MLLDDAEIVIMDEPLTGVDVFTFSDLLPELRKLFEDNRRTVVMFSHRLAFAAFADHVVVLGDNGTITEQGDPGTLLASKGEFAKLWASAHDELAVQPALQPQQRSR